LGAVCPVLLGGVGCAGVGDAIRIILNCYGTSWCATAVFGGRVDQGCGWDMGVRGEGCKDLDIVSGIHIVHSPHDSKEVRMISIHLRKECLVTVQTRIQKSAYVLNS
jgi:hypothetical protein